MLGTSMFWVAGAIATATGGSLEQELELPLPFAT